MLKQIQASLITGRNRETLVPFWNWEAVVCVVEARGWGVADICDLGPGTALQKNTFLKLLLLWHLNNLKDTFLLSPVISCSFPLYLIYPPHLCFSLFVCHPQVHFLVLNNLLEMIR